MIITPEDLDVDQEGFVPLPDQEDLYQDQEDLYQDQGDILLMDISPKIVLVMNQLIHLVSASYCVCVMIINCLFIVEE